MELIATPYLKLSLELVILKIQNRGRGLLNRNLKGPTKQIQLFIELFVPNTKKYIILTTSPRADLDSNLLVQKRLYNL